MLMIRSRFGSTLLRFLSTWFVLLPLAACGDDAPASEPLPPPVAAEPLFPADFSETFQEVRNCRPSSEHDLARVRVFADATAQATYATREGEFAVGATLVKTEYDGTDSECSGAVVQWTVMQRLAAGSSPDTLDWQWQRVSNTREVLGQDEPRCTNCHSGCDAPGGYFNTCALP
jgi:hypothetical protein